MRARNQVKFWRDSGLEVAHRQQTDHSFPAHTHDFYSICLMEEGSTFCLPAPEYGPMIKPGMLALASPGQVHTCTPHNANLLTYTMFYISKRLMNRLASKICRRPVEEVTFNQMALDDHEVAKAFMRLSNLVEAGAEPMARELALYEALALLLAEYGKPGFATVGNQDENRIVAGVRRDLESNLDRKVSLDELVKVSGLSRYHLVRVFKKATGLSPYAYHVQKRIEEGKSLLRCGVPILDAALDTGFTDQSHFSKAFVQYVGATPGQYLAR